MSATITIDNRPCTPLEATRIADKLLTQGNVQLAGAIYTEALRLAPRQAEAHIGLGYVQIALDNWTEALHHAHQARTINPKILKAYHLALMAMHKRLPFKAMRTWCDQGLEHFPNDPYLLYQRAHIASLERNAAETLDLATRTIRNLDAKDTEVGGMALALINYTHPSAEWHTILSKIPNNHLHPVTQNSFLIQQAIGLWLSNAPLEDIRKIHARALKSFQSLGQVIETRSEREHNSLRITISTNNAYITMFGELCKSPSATLSQEDLNLPALYIIGDSHTVPSHRQAVTWHGKKYLTQSHLCMGAKLWHLISPTTTFQTREAIIDILARLPPDTPVMFQIGEIDCRATEGFIHAHKTKGTPLNQLIQETTSGACAWLAQHAGKRPVILSGIQAPHPERDNATFPSREEHEAYGRMIHDVNQAMKQQAKRYGWDFLDLYSLTVAPESFLSHAKWHLEKTHLKPATLNEAFTNHLVPAT